MKKIALHNKTVEFWFLMENTWLHKYLDGGPNLKGSHFNVVKFVVTMIPVRSF